MKNSHNYREFLQNEVNIFTFLIEHYRMMGGYFPYLLFSFYFGFNFRGPHILGKGGVDANFCFATAKTLPSCSGG